MPVKIYTDESIPVAVAVGLQRRHVAALSARDAGNLGLTDVTIGDCIHRLKEIADLLEPEDLRNHIEFL